MQVVRIGHPARLEHSVLEYSLDALVANSDSAGIILDVRRDIDKAFVCVCSTSTQAQVHFHTYTTTITVYTMQEFVCHYICDSDATGCVHTASWLQHLASHDAV